LVVACAYRNIRLSTLLLPVLILMFAAPPAGAQTRRKHLPQTKREREKYCASLKEEKRRETDICKTPEEREADARAAHLKELEDRERPTHTSFLRKLHLDGLWIPASLGAGQYGLIGTHLDVATIGRVHFFGPPGMMLALEQSEEGNWRLRPALTWGISIYLADVRIPGMKRPQLFFNLTKSWSGGGGFSVGRDMAGLSLAWKK
jgi:hypothetical protein